MRARRQHGHQDRQRREQPAEHGPHDIERADRVEGPGQHRVDHQFFHHIMLGGGVLAASAGCNLAVAIQPGPVHFPLAAGLLRTERQRDAAAERHPLGRTGRPDDIAAMAEFLLSTQADWISGQVFGVDGGMGAVRRFG